MAKKSSWAREIYNKVVIRVVTILIVALLSVVGILLFGKSLDVKPYVVKWNAWLTTEHSLTLSGWKIIAIFALPCCCISLIMLMLVRLKQKPRKYRHKNTVIKILAEWILENEDELTKGCIVKYDEIDAGKCLKKGSTRKYLKRVISNHNGLTSEHSDKQSALVRGTDEN